MKETHGYSIVIVDSGEGTNSAVANETYTFEVTCR